MSTEFSSIIKIVSVSAVVSMLPFGLYAQDENMENRKPQELKEIIVTADQNLFKIKGANRFVYEVYKDSTLINSNTLDALSRVPLLAVKKTGAIEAINGRKLVFKLNGLNDPLLKSLEQALTAIPADVIKTIEFREENSGDGKPILEVNIVTKGRLEGYRLQLNSAIHDNYWRNGIWTITKVKRLTMSGGYFNNWEWGHKSTSGTRQYRYDTPDTYLYDTESENEGYKVDMHNFELSASYDVDDRSFISIYGRALLKDDPRMNSRESTSIFNQEGNLSASYNNNYRMKFNDAEYTAQLKYERDLTSNHLRGNLSIGYEFYSRPIDQTTISSYDVKENNLGEGLNFLDLLDSHRLRLQTYVTNTLVANWSKEVNRNMKWEIYGKARARNERSSDEITMQPVLTDEPSYFESYTSSLLEHWANLTPKFAYYRDNRWEVRGGFVVQAYRHRIRTTGLKSDIVRKKFNILPFASAAIATRRNLILRLSYDMSNRVPDISALNPYMVRTQAGELSYGNPALKPEVGHKLVYEVSGKTGKLYSGSYVTATYTKDVALRYQFVKDGVMNITYGNIAQQRGISFSGYSSGRIHRNTYVRLRAAVDWNQYKAALLGEGNCGWSFNCRAYVEQELPWDLTLSAEASYYSPSILLQGRGGHSFSYDLNLYKQFFKRRLTVILDADSFLPVWYKQDYSRFGPSFSTSGYNRNFHASFSLTLRYEFGKLQARVKNGSANMDNSEIKKSY